MRRGSPTSPEARTERTAILDGFAKLSAGEKGKRLLRLAAAAFLRNPHTADVDTDCALALISLHVRDVLDGCSMPPRWAASAT